MSHTGKMVSARQAIAKEAERKRRTAKKSSHEGSSTLPDGTRMLVVQRLEAIAEGLELAAKIVEKLMRD